MDLRIGIAHMQKEVNLEMADDFDLSDFKSNLEEALKSETGRVAGFNS